MFNSVWSEDKKIQLLRNAVIGMGVALVVGVIVLFVMVIFKASSKEENGKNVISRKIDNSNLQCTYSEANNKIFLTGRLVSTKIEDNIITIVSSREILLYDLCLGKNIATFEIQNR